MLLAAVFTLLDTVLSNWLILCVSYYSDNEKCHGEPSEDWLRNIGMCFWICVGLSNMFWTIAHFLFAFRYLESAAMLGKISKTLAEHKRNQAISQKITYIGVGLITTNYLIFIANNGINFGITGNFNLNLDLWTRKIIPTVFILGFCVILLVALVWICSIFRHDKGLISSEI
jgi:hypothetical protein